MRSSNNSKKSRMHSRSAPWLPSLSGRNRTTSPEPDEQSQSEHLVYCIHQSVADWRYEVHAGGFGPDGEPEEVAQRELLEKVGGNATEPRCIGQLCTSQLLSLTSLLLVKRKGR